MSVEKVEPKIAFRNNKLTFHFDQWEPILHTLNQENNYWMSQKSFLIC